MEDETGRTAPVDDERVTRMLTREPARWAADAADPPAFDAMRQRAVVRRHRRRVLAGAATVAAMVTAVAGTVALDRALDGGETAPLQRPRQSSSSDADPDLVGRAEAERLLGAPTSILQNAVVAATDSDVRASAWLVCMDASCDQRRTLVLTTTDGFASYEAHQAPGGVPIQQAGEGTLLAYLGAGHRAFVSASGVTPLALSQGADSAEPEQPLVADTDGQPLVIDDAGQGTAYRLRIPETGSPLANVAWLGSRLIGWAGPRAYLSDDGGDTWRRAALPVDSLLTEPFTYGTAGVGAVQGGDGAGLFPLSRVVRSDDKGTSWQTFDIDWGAAGVAYGSVAGVRPDGRLILDVMSFADPENAPDPGFYSSAGDDWSRFERIDSQAPFDEAALRRSPRGDAFWSPMVTQHDPLGGIYATSADQRSWWYSDDGAVTWREVASR